MKTFYLPVVLCLINVLYFCDSAFCHISIGKFSFSPRLIVMGKQNLSGFGDTATAILKRQTIPGYQLLNVAVRYNITREIAFFANATNALNQRYRSVGFNMDLSKAPTDLYYGQHQDPIRIFGGINFNL